MDAQAGLQPHKIQLLQECFLVNFGNAVRTDILENFIWHLYSGTDAYKVPGKQLPVQTQQQKHYKKDKGRGHYAPLHNFLLSGQIAFTFDLHRICPFYDLLI